MEPRTPSSRRGRSDSKTPLKPAAPSAADTSVNPFIAKNSGSSSSTAAAHSLHRQASAGVIRRGAPESKLDVVKVTEPQVQQQQQQQQQRRSRSTPAAGRGDRFIAARDDVDALAASLDLMALASSADAAASPLPASRSSPGHTARLAAATGIDVHRRILAFHEAPPAPSSDRSLAAQRAAARPLYARPAALPSSTGAATSKTRTVPTQPERVLDAPGLLDDFYLNLLSWSAQNTLAVALAEHTYVWHADTGVVRPVAEAPAGTYVSAVEFSNDGAFLAIALGTGAVELWDAGAGQKLRTMAGHQGQVAALSWAGHVLSSACADGSVWNHDVRIPRHKVAELLGHSAEVCGLKWREDGELLASGGNDNVVNIWDARSLGSPKWTKRNHTAAVKALAWCPWQPSLLASGGGTNDAHIHVWNSTTGARLHSLRTPAQVTSLQWSPHSKELLSTHGFPTNALMLHAYPSLAPVAEIRDAHDARVLYSARSPAGDVVCTGAGDENLKFWRVWEPEKAKKKVVQEAKEPSATRPGILSIR